MGGIKSCVTPFGADQFEPEEEAGRASFFNWSYGVICLGSIIGTIAVIFILENIGWGIGYAICAAAFVGGLVIFVLGWGWYKKVDRIDHHDALKDGSFIIRLSLSFCPIIISGT